MTPETKPNTIQRGDALETLTTMAAESVDMVLTSPPYFRLRNYRHARQLGAEADVEQWSTNLQAIAQELHRVLRPHGTFWLNLGDTYATHQRQGAAYKSLLMAPERLALALVKEGWVLRNKVVWKKPNGMPSNVTDRLTPKWEYVYVFAKQPQYFFDLDAIRIPHTSKLRPASKTAALPPKNTWWKGSNATTSDSGLARMKAEGRVGHIAGKNPGDVWTIPTSAWRGDHHAVYPTALAERAMTAGCPEATCTTCHNPYRRKLHRALGETAIRGALQAVCACPNSVPTPGVVLDPFMGSGTTALAAERLKRNWLGIELNPDFAKLANQRIQQAKDKDLETKSNPKGGK